MDRTLTRSDFASASPVDLIARPRRRWSDGANYAWSLAEEDASVDTHWPALVALLCEQVARGCAEIDGHIDGHIHGHEESGLDSPDAAAALPLDALRASTSSMRATSMLAQQIVRLNSGSFRPSHEPMDLARVARRISHTRLREFVQHRAEISFDIRPADAVVDGSVAERLMNVALDWGLSFSRRVRLKVGTVDGSRAVHLIVRATLPRPSETSESGTPRRERRMNDNIHWMLLRQLALWSQLPVSRSSTAATESVVIQFPSSHTSPGHDRRSTGRG